MNRDVIKPHGTMGATCDRKFRQPDNLLEACCYWSDNQGGIIHEFLPQLKWSRHTFRKIGKVYSLFLGDRCIGFSECADLQICADLNPIYLHKIPIDQRITSMGESHKYNMIRMIKELGL